MKKFLIMIAIAFLSMPAYVGAAAMTGKASMMASKPSMQSSQEGPKEAAQEDSAPKKLSNEEKMDKAVDDLKLASKRLEAIAKTDPQAEDLQKKVEALIEEVKDKKKDIGKGGKEASKGAKKSSAARATKVSAAAAA